MSSDFLFCCTLTNGWSLVEIRAPNSKPRNNNLLQWLQTSKKEKISFWNFLLLLKVQRGRLWDLRLFENVMQFLSQAHRKNLITFCWKLCYTAISHIFFYYCHFFVTIFLWYSTKLSIIHVLHKKSFFHIWANIFWMVSLSRS